ncbi:copper resistance CopC/CopD family protein [Streptomyces fuscichromogenes]|uniref:copper resistance CopC/CopD family protein n=1 Tax=Streptomyces fuscichromogenes TaxID=1324013 RepID=UPI003824B827
MYPGPRSARTPLTVLALVGAVLALLLGGAGAASAHASLTGSDPADGSVVKTAPEQVTLTFTEGVGFPDGALRVLSPDNERVNPRTAEHANGKANTARVALAGKLPEGTYTVAWRVVSADSHPISGAFTFSIGKPSETSVVVAPESSDDTAASRLYDAFRYVAYGGLALLIGAAAFVLVCWPAAGARRSVRRLLTAGWATLLAATVALVLLRGPYETGGSLTSALDPSQLSATLTGRSGTALGVRLVLLAGVALFVRKWVAVGDERPVVVGRRVVGGALAVALAVTWAAAEHASAGPQVPLAVPVAVLHLLAMAVWLGGLVTLVAVLRRPAATGAGLPVSAIVRFSAVAFTAVVVLVLTGLYQSWRQVGSWDALSLTSYGRILTFKLFGVIAVLCVAAFSRQWTARLVDHDTQPAGLARPVRVAQAVGGAAADVPAESSGGDADTGSAPEPERNRRGLRRMVTVEAVLGVVVLAITTVLTGTQPSRAEAENAAAAAAQKPPAKVVMVPFDMGTPGGHGTVQITLAPGLVGDNTVQAVVYAADGGLSAVPELRLTLTQKAQRIGPLDAGLKDQGGYWATYDLRMPIAGTWTMNVTVRTTDVDQVTVRRSVEIAKVPGR